MSGGLIDGVELYDNSPDNEYYLKTHVKVNPEGRIMNTLKFWEMKGMTLTDVEDTYNFDFVVVGDCIPVVNNGNFVIVRR